MFGFTQRPVHPTVTLGLGLLGIAALQAKRQNLLIKYVCGAVWTTAQYGKEIRRPMARVAHGVMSPRIHYYVKAVSS
jgi:hypothetical protein